MPIKFAECFLSSAAAKVGEDGLIWKPMLPAGTWAVGPHGKPLQIIPGNSSDQLKQIGLRDIVDSFESGAVPHVTIPKTHEDKVDENTGFIRKVKIEDHNGVPTLFGGHEFTDPAIAQKVAEGSIANTSAGLKFNYVRKTDGRQFPVVLEHNALTNRPWLGDRLAPFGVNADESEETYEVMSLSLPGGTVDPEEANEFPGAPDDEAGVLESAANTALITAKIHDILNCVSGLSHPDLQGADRDAYVVNGLQDLLDDFTGDADGDLPDAAPEVNYTEADTSTSGSAANIDSSNHSEDETVPDDKKPETETQPTPAPADAVTTAQFSEVETKLSVQEDENKALRARLARQELIIRENEADKYVEKLRGIGLSEENGCTVFLTKVRSVMLADSGEGVIQFAEGDEAPKSLSATDLVKTLVDALPSEEETGKLKARFGEQAVAQAAGAKPPLDGGPEGEAEQTQLSEDDVDTLFKSLFPSGVVA